MRIENIRRTVDGPDARLSATVMWESIRRDPEEVFFSVPAKHARFLDRRGDAFLTIGALIASMAREKRIVVDGVDPQLVDGVRTALAWLQHWYPDEVSRIDIVANGYQPRGVIPGRVAGSMLSGGIDSLALVRSNHLSLPEGHPTRISAGVLINWNAGATRELDVLAFESVERRRRSFTDFVDDIPIYLIPLYSNVMSLLDYPRGKLWSWVLHGSAFAAAGHALSAGLHTVFIGSSDPAGVFLPWGSSPLTDNVLSSAGFEFVHTGQEMTRIEKTSLVAEWGAGLDVLTVCAGSYAARAVKRNCGECEKCLRSAAVFHAIGRFERAAVFGDLDRQALLERIETLFPPFALVWPDLPPLLRAAGDAEMASAVERLVGRVHRRDRLRGILSTGSRLDQRLFGGRIRRRFHRGPTGLRERESQS